MIPEHDGQCPLCGGLTECLEAECHEAPGHEYLCEDCLKSESRRQERYLDTLDYCNETE